MSERPTNRVPAGSWIVCPDGHKIAKAVDGVTIGSPRNWRAALTEKAEGLQPKGFTCPTCVKEQTAGRQAHIHQWVDSRGGRGLVRYETVAPESRVIITE